MSSCNDELEFPKKIYNRPGLDNIDFRIGDYQLFRKYVLHQLGKNKVLRGWTHRSPDDPAFALLEGACIIADILTVYQQVYANESYLRTSIERQSIIDLVKLLGYRVSPGTGGQTFFAIEIKGNIPIMIPSHVRVKAELVSSDQPVIFETKQELLARPALNKFYLYPPLVDTQISETTKELYVSEPEGLQINLKIEPDDRILIGEQSEFNSRRLINTEIIIVDKVRNVRGRTIITIKGKLNRTNRSDTVIGFKIKNSYGHFGRNAPKKIITIQTNNTDEKTISYMRHIQNQRQFPIDSQVENLAIGTTLVIQGFFLPDNFKGGSKNRKRLTLIRRIINIIPTISTWGAASGPTSLITLDEPLETKIGSTLYIVIDIRKIQFHEASDPKLNLKALEKRTSEQKGKKFYLDGLGESEINILEGRRLALATKNKEPVTATVLLVHKDSNSLELEKELDYNDFPNEEPITEVYGNVIETDQGKGEKEILGSGDARQEFQTFKLSKSPLTYFNSSSESPPEVPELKVYVNDQQWKRTSSFFGKNPNEKIWKVIQDENGNTWIQFNSRLPSGLDNISVEYRTGLSALGSQKPDSDVKALSNNDIIETVRMVEDVSGGSKPEHELKAKEAAPGKIRSLGRLVSLDDYESEALSIAGVLKARAVLTLEKETPIIKIKILSDGNAYKNPGKIQEILFNYDRCRGSQRYPINVIDCKFQYIFIEADYGLDPIFRKDVVENEIQNTLAVYRGEEQEIPGSTGLFQMKNRKFGEPVYATSVEGVIQSVEGVIWAKVKAMYSLGESSDPVSIVPLANPTLESLITCNENNVLRLYFKHLKLNDVAVRNVKEC